MKLATAEEMRGLDLRAIEEYGIPGIVLMENAGRRTVSLMAKWLGSLKGLQIAVFVGPGNNGGDGLVIARHLHQLGGCPTIFLLLPPDQMKGDAAVNYAIVEKLPIASHVIAGEEEIDKARHFLAGVDVIVDAIFGTGLTREVSGNFYKIIEAINESGRPVIAVDIPSGLDSDNGFPLAISVKADKTVTYGLAKPGHVVYPGVEYTGALHVVDIGIPPEVVGGAGLNIELLQKSTFAGVKLRRGPDSHKGSYGHLLIVAGSLGKTGAAILAVKGSLRCGSGLVSLCVPGGLNAIFESCLFEAMTVPLGDGCIFSEEDYLAIENEVKGKSAMVVGPGIGADGSTFKLVQKLYGNIKLPMVVDADALNLLSTAKDMIKKHAGPRVLTPHPGEMARLTGLTVPEIQANRIETASSFAVENGVVVVLKGAATIIAAPDGKIAINSTGNSTMAAGGMGDVLSGVIGSLLGQGLNGWEAACLGVYVHGLAADRLVANNNISFGVLASEVARELPLAFQDLAGAANS